MKKLGYRQLNDFDWRNELLNGRIMFYNDNLDIVISIQDDEVVKYGGIEILCLTVDELIAIYKFLLGGNNE